VQSLLILIYLLAAIGLTPGGSNAVHIYSQKIHRTTQLKITTQLTKNNTINKEQHS